MSQAGREMDEEMNSLAASAASAVATSMAVDLWLAVRSAIVRICRRRQRGRGESPAVPAGDSRQAILRQENIALDAGTVFAVQSGELHFYGNKPAS